MPKIDHIPSQRARLRRPQPMPKPNEHHRRVAMPVPTAIVRGLHEQLDFLDGEIFAWSPRGVANPPGRYCLIYSYWRPSPAAFFAVMFPCAGSHDCPVKSPFRDS
jgi:hypothetical protein